MKFICISDTHGKHNKIDFSKYNDIDTLIFAGDWTSGIKYQDIENTIFLEWLFSLDFKNIILVAGNHEVYLQKIGKTRFKEQIKLLKNILHSEVEIHYLEDDSIILEDIKIYGSPYSGMFCNWAFMGSEMELFKTWEKIEEDIDILITHGPAYGCHDLVKNTYNRDPHVGSKSLRYKKIDLEKNNLKFHISGHIHEESYKVNNIDNITNICSSVLNENYLYVEKKFITFELNKN